MRAKVDPTWIEDVLVADSPIRVPRTDLIALTARLSLVHIDAGTVMYAEGKHPDGVWIIRRGGVEISEGAGPQRSVVAIARAGDVVGDVYILLGAPSPFTARCFERTDAWFMSADGFRRLLATHASLAVAWSCNLAARVSLARDRVLEVLGRSLSQRLARLLRDQAVDGTLRAPQKTLAQMLGVQRTSVNKVLKEWERCGLVHLGYGAVHIVDPNAIATIADRDALTTPTLPAPRKIAGRSTRPRPPKRSGTKEAAVSHLPVAVPDQR